MPTVGGLVIEVAANVARLQKDVDAIRGHFGRLQSTQKEYAQTSKGIFDQIKDGWVGVATKIYAVEQAMTALQKAGEYITLGAKAQQAAASFSIVAKSFGENADEIVAAMKRASAGTVDDSDIMQKAVKGMVQGLSGNQMVEIMKAARVSARVAGEDVKDAYENITDAIANKLPRALIKYGLVTKEQLKVLNKAIADGNDDIDLYGIAMANAGKQSAIFGGVTADTKEELQKLNAIINELKEGIGVGLYRVIQGMGLAFVDTAQVIVAPFALIEKGLNKLGIAGSLWQNTFEEQTALSEKYTKGMMGVSDANTKVAGSVVEVDKKIKAMMDNLKGQDALKKSAEDAKKLATEYSKVAEGLTLKMVVINLNEFDKQRKELETEVADLRKKFGDKPLFTEYFDIKMASIQAEQVKKIYENMAKTAKESALKILEDNKKNAEKEITYLTQYREYLSSTYDYAISKAQEYYKTSADLEEKIAHGKSFMAGLNEKPGDMISQMEKEKKAINEMVTGEGINIFDTKNTTRTMDAIEKFLEKYKGTQDVLGFDVDFSGVKKDYDDLISKLEVSKNNTEQAADAWTEYANKQAIAIQTVDEWIQYLQNKIVEMDAQISTVRKIQIDTSTALDSVQNLITQIQFLNAISGRGAITSAASIVSSGEGFTFETGPVVMGEYATGTNYVPKTGPYKLHQGEAVIPANKNTQNNNFSPTIVVQGGDGKSIAKEIDKELAKLWQYNRSALKKVMA